MHDASSGLGLISLDLAGVCVVCTACDAVRGGPAVVPFVRKRLSGWAHDKGGWVGMKMRRTRFPRVWCCVVCVLQCVCVCVCARRRPLAAPVVE